jgi:stage II sporulation protein Q
MNKDQQNKPMDSGKTPEKTNHSQGGWKKFLGKKWAFPAIYMAAAALILTFMWWYQDPGEYSVKNPTPLGGVVVDDKTNPDVEATTPKGEGAVPVQAGVQESMAWPVMDPATIDVIMGFYDEQGSEEAKASALLQYEGQWYTHNGVDIANAEGTEFDVVAALSGNVTLVEEHPAVGYQVEITHDNGLVTVYQSLGEITVKEGDVVKQNQVIGQAGRNEFEKDHGIHLHFEVRGQDGKHVNPDQYLAQR